MKKQYETELVQIHNPDMKNFIFGQSHFIKTVEDVHELMVTSIPGVEYGLAFCEASGPRLIRTAGTNRKMINLAVKNAMAVSAGHTFFLFLEDAFPINVTNGLKMIPEVVRIFCATANPVQVIVASSDQGRGVLGVIDGSHPLGVEKAPDAKARKKFLRDIGYKS